MIRDPACVAKTFPNFFQKLAGTAGGAGRRDPRCGDGALTTGVFGADPGLRSLRQRAVTRERRSPEVLDPVN